MLQSWVIVVLVLFYGHENVNSSQVVNDSDYNSLPPIYELDPFEQCEQLGTSHQYCMFELNILPIPNVSSHMMDVINLVNTDPRNFRHNIINKGRCVLNDGQSMEDLADHFGKNFNSEFSKYDVQVNTTRVLCNKFVKEFDTWDKIGTVILATIIFVVLACSVYDFNDNGENLKSRSFCVRLIQCFSIWKNWVRLRTMKNARQNLKYVQGIRFITISLVIFGHTSFIVFNALLENPQYFEKVYQNAFSGVAFNGAVIVQTFFLFSGMVLALPFYDVMAREKVTVRYFALAVIGRYVRISFSYAVIILINATVLYHASTGPMWELNLGVERQRCRTHWWNNLLYINNEVNVYDMCMQTGWYLAADFQLYLMCLVLLAMVWLWKRHIHLILGGALIIALVIPGVLTYIYSLHPITLQFPELMRTVYEGDITFRKTYIPFYSNAASYIWGLIMGYWLYTGKLETKFTETRSMGFTFQIIAWTCGLGQLIGGSYFYSDWYVYDRMVAAIFAGLYKFTFTVAISIIIWFIEHKTWSGYRNLLEWRPMVIFGRLSFSAYLVHWSFIKTQASMEYRPVYYTSYLIFEKLMSNIIISFLLALVLSLFVELPVSALSSLIFGSQKKDDVRMKKNAKIVFQDKNQNNDNNLVTLRIPPLSQKQFSDSNEPIIGGQSYKPNSINI